MDPTCILMCANIPRGIPEDVLVELFCVAGPIEDVSISKSGRSCFIIYEFPEAVPTAKEIFKDVKLFGRPLEMLDESDIKQIHQQQEHENLELQQKEIAYAEIAKQYNPFYNRDSMTPTFHNNPRGYGHPRNFPPPQNVFDPSQNHFNNVPNQFNSPQNPFNPAQNYSYGDNYDPSVPTRTWGSAADTNQVQSFPPGLDSFQNPYSQSVSRNSYEQNRRNDYDDDVSDANYSVNRERHPKHKNRQNPNDNAEYENRSHSRKSYRDNDRYDNSKYNGASSSSDYSNRQKSRDYDRSPYPRNDYRRSDQRDSRRHDYRDKEHRNRRR